jgi:hypothetical protein
MFYWLTEFSNQLNFLNVFRYITFRTGGAIVTAMVFVFLFGGPFIDMLRVRQGKGQPIRDDGPASHLMSMKGTRRMGGLMILSGLLVSTLLWANPMNPYVWIVLGDMLELGDQGAALHRDLGATAAENADLVFCSGPLMRSLFEALPSARRGGYADTSAALEGAVLDAVGPGDVVMIKGSFGSKMGPIVKALERKFPRQAALDPA